MSALIWRWSGFSLYVYLLYEISLFVFYEIYLCSSSLEISLSIYSMKYLYVYLRLKSLCRPILWNISVYLLYEISLSIYSMKYLCLSTLWNLHVYLLYEISLCFSTLEISISIYSMKLIHIVISYTGDIWQEQK